MSKSLSILTGACLMTQAGLAANLLSNGDFSSGNVGFSSGYVYISSGQSQTVSTYGVRTVSTDFNSLYNSFHDHTTGSGNMLLVDGANSASVMVWSENVTVQPNTSYIFTGWVASSDGGNPATLHFTVNGTQVGSDLPLSTTAAQWQQFSFVWFSGSSTSAQISFTDLNTISEGNDFALDDLSFTTNNLTPVTATIFPAVEIDWNSQTNVNYQLQYTTNVAGNLWNNVGDPIPGTGATLAAFDSSHGHPQRFYRIVVLP